MANNDGNRFSIFVLSGGLSADSKEQLSTVVEGGGNIEFITVEEKSIEGFASTIKGGDHVSFACYYRLFCAELLPKVKEMAYRITCLLGLKENKETYIVRPVKYGEIDRR